MSRPNTILAQCQSCGGTGLYRGFAEREGEPVVCITCGGTGAERISYTPFTGRKQKNGVKCVRISRGPFIATGIGGIERTEMTYEEFQRKFPPPSV